MVRSEKNDKFQERLTEYEELDSHLPTLFVRPIQKLVIQRQVNGSAA